jgi:hypothetical protein
MEAAKTIFDALRTYGIDEINRFVVEKEQETLLLDFKEAQNGRAPMGDGDRQTLGKALSGFANSEGGCIVWGIEARQGSSKDDPDCAQALKPISNLARWMSDLHQFTASLVSPAVVGVEHHAIPSSDNGETGYAVTYVPRSDGYPHMAIAKDQHRYYFRGGSSFLKMESFMVADRFGRRAQPKLSMVLKIGSVEMVADIGRKPITTRRLTVSIENSGLGIARHPAIRIKPNELFNLDPFGIDGNRNHNLYLQLEDPTNFRGYYFLGRGDDVIHPGTKRDVTRLCGTVSNEGLIGKEVTFDFELYCDGFVMIDTLSFPITINTQTGATYRSK